MDSFWKRKPRPSKAKETLISSPILTESTVDHDVLQSYPDITNSQASQRSPTEAPSPLAPLPL